MIYTSLFFCFLGLSVKKERGVNTSVIAPLFCPQSLDNLSEKISVNLENGGGIMWLVVTIGNSYIMSTNYPTPSSERDFLVVYPKRIKDTNYSIQITPDSIVSATYRVYNPTKYNFRVAFDHSQIARFHITVVGLVD